MSKRNQYLDPNQQQIPFQERVLSHLKESEEILNEIHNDKPNQEIENCEDACMAMAVACKKAVKESGVSRAEVADEINRYFGWPTSMEMEALKADGADKGRKHLSEHMFNHYLSKPVEYPMPAYFLYALNHVTGSLAACQSLAEAEDGEVVSGPERKVVTIGKLVETRAEANRLLRELCKGKKKTK